MITAAGQHLKISRVKMRCSRNVNSSELWWGVLAESVEQWTSVCVSSFVYSAQRVGLSGKQASCSSHEEKTQSRKQDGATSRTWCTQCVWWCCESYKQRRLRFRFFGVFLSKLNVMSFTVTVVKRAAAWCWEMTTWPQFIGRANFFSTDRDESW